MRPFNGANSVVCRICFITVREAGKELYGRGGRCEAM